MAAFRDSSRAATLAGVLTIVVASAVILATGSSVAYVGPALVGGVALGTIVGLLLPEHHAPDDAPERRRLGVS